LVRKSKIQISKIALYWAGFTLVFSILWSILLNAFHLAGMGPALSLIAPVLLGLGVSVLVYFSRDHEVLEYDDNGYETTKGRKATARQEWRMFKECSVVKDGYGRNKIRAYFDRDGRHSDIDASGCGVDPYVLRDFIFDHIRSTKLDRSVIFEGLEREIQRGRASWVADLTETFREYQISGEVFPLIARGGTRPRGFLLSKFVAFTLMPNYNVCLYACMLDAERNNRADVMRRVRILETQRDQKDIKWSWLLLLAENDPPSATATLIEEFGNKDIGIGCINIVTGRVITSPNQLGRSLTGQMRMNRLIQDIRSRNYPGARNYPSTR